MKYNVMMKYFTLLFFKVGKYLEKQIFSDVFLNLKSLKNC